MKQKPVTPTPPPWTLEDTYEAYRDGWGVFEQEDGSAAIQRLDDPGACPPEANVIEVEPQFDCDENAVAHVHQMARMGIAVAKRAVAMVKHYGK